MTNQYLRDAAGLPLSFAVDDETFDARWFLGDEEIAALPQPKRLTAPLNGFTHIIQTLSGKPIGLTAENVATIEAAIQAKLDAYKASPEYAADSKI